MRFDECLQSCPLIAILRGISPEEVIPISEVLYESGFRLLEIPLNTPQALQSIRLAASQGEGRFLVGAGTVLAESDVCEVQAAGGHFIISPDVNEAVIQETKRRNLISIPGMFTATEAFAAIRAGADYLKLFPAILGPEYVKALKAVVTKPILAVGGVSTENLRGLLDVCAGAGIGSSLYKRGKSRLEVENEARTLMAMIKRS